MHDLQYRAEVARQQTTYNQPSYTGLVPRERHGLRERAGRSPSRRSRSRRSSATAPAQGRTRCRCGPVDGVAWYVNGERVTAPNGKVRVDGARGGRRGADGLVPLPGRRADGLDGRLRRLTPSAHNAAPAALLSVRAAGAVRSARPSRPFGAPKYWQSRVSTPGPRPRASVAWRRPLVPPLRRPPMSAPAAPTAADRRRWARYLVNERAEARLYRELARAQDGRGPRDPPRARRRRGPPRGALAHAARRRARTASAARSRHPHARVDGAALRHDLRARARAAGRGALAVRRRRRGHRRDARRREDPPRGGPRTRGARAPAPVRHLPRRGLRRERRPRVSNLALVLGIGATGVAPQFVLFSGIAGLLAGALSMGAGEFVSVRSQRELLAATEPNGYADDVLPDLDLDANELALVYRTRGMEATRRSRAPAWSSRRPSAGDARPRRRTTAPTRTTSSGARGARRSRASCSSPRARSSRCCRGSSGSPGSRPSSSRSCSSASRCWPPGAMVGLLSGGPPLRRALRQLLIGYGAAAITYCLGLLFGVSMG